MAAASPIVELQGPGNEAGFEAGSSGLVPPATAHGSCGGGRLGAVRARLPATFLERDLLVEDGAFLEVRGELPLVGGMGLGDVDEREVRAIAESLEEALDIARPATKGRSGVAAEDEQQRSVADELSELDRREIVGVSHGDGGEGVSRLKRFGVAVAEQARNHRFALRSGGEALDVAAVFRVDDRPGRAVL